MSLWDFQETAVEALRENIRAGVTNQVLCAPTGSGKTEMAMHLIEECNAKRKRAVFVVDRISLLDQTSARFDAHGIQHGVIQAQHWRFRPWNRIQVASVQTVARRNWPDADLIIVDECHALHQTTLNRIKHRDTTVVGLTATPFTRGLGKHYDRVVCSTTTQKLIEDGYLAPFKIFAASEPDMEGAKTVAGEWTDDEAAKRSMPIVGDCVAEYLKHGNDGKAIAFGCTVAHCEELQRQFLAAGVQTGLYTYRTGDEERARMLEEYRKPDSYIRVLISVAALARGFDVPDVRVVILARPLKKSLAEHVQMLGRGLRKDPDDPDKTCIVLDHAGNSLRFWDAMTVFFEEGISELDMGVHRTKKKAEKKAPEPRKCPSCKHVHKPLPACPLCGFAYPRKVVRHEAGELEELGNGADGALVRQRFYGEMLWIARDRGYKDGWAAHKYRERYQRWPRGLPDKPVTPSLETLNWVKFRQIAWAKSKKAKWSGAFARL